jgi:hypothetical protein
VAGWCRVSPVSHDHDPAQAPTFDDAVDAATVLGKLSEYRVVAVRRDALGATDVFIDTLVVEAACPACGPVRRGASGHLPAGSGRRLRRASHDVVGQEAVAVRQGPVSEGDVD